MQRSFPPHTQNTFEASLLNILWWQFIGRSCVLPTFATNTLSFWQSKWAISPGKGPHFTVAGYHLLFYSRSFLIRPEFLYSALASDVKGPRRSIAFGGVWWRGGSSLYVNGELFEVRLIATLVLRFSVVAHHDCEMYSYRKSAPNITW